MKALIVDELVVSYGDFVAVQGAGFGVEAGEVFGLLGPNGAGKTSIMRVLTTLLRPAAGRAWILGHEVAAEAATVRQLIGYVPQALSADGSLTDRENASLFAQLHRVPRPERAKRIDAMLELMDIGGAADRVVRSYSGAWCGASRSRVPCCTGPASCSSTNRRSGSIPSPDGPCGATSRRCARRPGSPCWSPPT